MKCIIYHESTSQTCTVLHVAPEMLDSTSRTRALVPELDGLSDDEIIKWVADKDVPKGVAYSIVDSSLVPLSRTFRNAWVLSDGNINIDLALAKEIKLDELRVIRKPLLESLDVEYMKALESNGDISSIAKQKQGLRDVTAIPLPDNIDELEVFIPDILKVG